MKNLKFGLLLVFVILACGSSAWATYILKVDSYEMYLRQGDYCPADANTYCNDNLNYLVSTYWSNPNSSLPLKLGSDIDLGELKADGHCNFNHTPLKFSTGVNATFDGNGKVIKNLCYEKDLKDGAMTAPVGFFDFIDGKQVTNVQFANARIVIKDSRTGRNPATAGTDYFPVGVLAGNINMSYIGSGTISDVTIQAPLAGGVAGYISSSTVEGFVVTEDVFVNNQLELSGGAANFAGKTFASTHNPMMWASRYSVFLGGIAGAAHHVTFKNLSVHVNVSDSSSANTPSAVGGVAGMYTYAGSGSSNPSEYSVTIENVNLTKEGSSASSTSSTTLYGGSAMGGLFGETNIFGDSRDVGKLTIQNITANVYIRGAASDSVFAGGLVGRSDPPLGSSLLFDNNHVNIDLKDTVIPNINQKYFAGGMVGYFGRINGGNADSASFPTFSRSSAEGQILVDGNPSSVGTKTDAVNLYLGGFAGIALFTWNGHGLSYDTSSVNISSKAFGVDSVFVGGFVGLADVDGNGGTEDLAPRMIYENDVFEGSISVVEDVNSTFAGGIVGMFMNLWNNKSVYFEKVAVKNVSVPVVAVQNASGSSEVITSVGGVCGWCSSVNSATILSVIGDVVVSGSAAQDSVMVGGLFGNLNTSSRQISTRNTFTRGNISAPAEGFSRAGYLAGMVSAADSFAVEYNYHYGKSDEVASVGYFNCYNNDLTAVWMNDPAHPLYSAKYNIRNGEITSLDANNNGLQVVTAMQKASFAGFMNTAQNPYVWTFEKDMNDNFPFFADATHAAVSPSDVRSYTVSFFDADEKTLLSMQTVQEGANAIPPSDPVRTGYTFTGWKGDYKNVSGQVNVIAQYKINTYVVKFMLGTEVLQESAIEYNVMPTSPSVKVPAKTAEYTYSFGGWNPEIVAVSDTATYTAIIDSVKNKYLVTFKNGETVLQSGEVEYGVVPTAPSVTLPANTAQYTYSFGGWNTDVVAVTEAATYVAVIDSSLNSYKVTFVDYDFVTVLDEQVVFYGASAKAPAEPTREAADGIAYTFEKWSEDFSVVTGNMTVVAVYGSSVIPSSSSEEPQSSSSSIEPESSSSSVEFVEIVEPRIEQSGNAIRLTFGTNNFDVANKTSARVVVLGDEGVYMDTVLTDSITDAAARGEWVLSPAPIGKFTVKLVLASDVAADSCEKGFTVSGEIEVQPRSWQMIALSALDMAALRDKDDAAFYWWDEVNPIGDYWQYRAYEESAEYNETQGFWYGTKDGNPLKLKAETPTQDAEIVWELDNRYSGWNLVANPHGWYVNMQDAEKCDAEFWRWNPVTAEYETVAILAPYEAIWAKVNAPTTCRISSAPDFSIAMEGAEEPETLAKKALAKSSKGMDWSLRAVLSDASGKKDSWNVIGSGNGANMEEPPAGMGDHVNLSIVEGKSRFAKFVKAAAESYSWNMEVNASSARDGFLSFEGLETLAAKGMKVFVTVDGKTIEMTNGKSVQVSLKKDSKTVTVQVSKSAPVVSSNALKGLRAVQQGGSLQIGFTADGMNGTQGLVQLVGVNGKIAATSKFTAVGGANLVTVAAPKSGVYFLRVKVGSQMTSAKFLVK